MVSDSDPASRFLPLVPVPTPFCVGLLYRTVIGNKTLSTLLLVMMFYHSNRKQTKTLLKIGNKTRVLTFSSIHIFWDVLGRAHRIHVKKEFNRGSETVSLDHTGIM